MINADSSVEINGIRLDVHPKPTPDEAAAIVGAVRVMLNRAASVEESEPSGWRVAARRESLHRELDPGSNGWRLAARLEP